jgi:hypothetical protein
MPGNTVCMNRVTSGMPLPSLDIAVTHSFINFPKVLPLSGQFSQCPWWAPLGQLLHAALILAPEMLPVCTLSQLCSLRNSG